MRSGGRSSSVWFSGGMSSIECVLWGDLLDPWSWIAKRRLEQAVAETVRPAEVEVTFASLPGPPASLDSLERATVEGRPDGVDIVVTAPPRFETLDAHRVVRLVLDLGGPALQSAVLERLYAGAFSEGLDLGSPSVLTQLAPEAGLDEGRVEALLESDERSAEVGEGIASAQQLGLDATPALVVDERVAMQGVAGTRDYAELLARVAEA